MDQDATATRLRSGGRSARRAKRTAPNFEMLPGLTRNFPVCEIMNEEHVHRIDDASMDILENIGIVFRDDIALQDWKIAGADVRGDRVHLDRGLIRELIKTIPAQFTYHARDPNKNVRLGGNHSVFVPMTGAPYLRDYLETLDDAAFGHYLKSAGKSVINICPGAWVIARSGFAKEIARSSETPQAQKTDNSPA